jgi:DNA primase
MAQKLFERRCMGNVPDSMLKKLTQNYDIEHANINQIIAKKRNMLMKMENAAIDISPWQKQYTNIDKLDRRIMTTLIDSKSTNETGVTRQHITVNYKFVGQLSA